MIMSFLNMNDECGCFLSFQNKTCSLLILTSAFSCARELTDCKESLPSVLVQIKINLHVYLPPNACKCIYANIYVQIQAFFQFMHPGSQDPRILYNFGIVHIFMSIKSTGVVEMFCSVLLNPPAHCSHCFLSGSCCLL